MFTQEQLVSELDKKEKEIQRLRTLHKNDQTNIKRAVEMMIEAGFKKGLFIEKLDDVIKAYQAQFDMRVEHTHTIEAHERELEICMSYLGNAGFEDDTLEERIKTAVRLYNDYRDLVFKANAAFDTAGYENDGLVSKINTALQGHKYLNERLADLDSEIEKAGYGSLQVSGKDLLTRVRQIIDDAKHDGELAAVKELGDVKLAVCVQAGFNGKATLVENVKSLINDRNELHKSLEKDNETLNYVRGLNTKEALIKLQLEAYIEQLESVVRTLICDKEELRENIDNIRIKHGSNATDIRTGKPPAGRGDFPDLSKAPGQE